MSSNLPPKIKRGHPGIKDDRSFGQCFSLTRPLSIMTNQTGGDLLPTNSTSPTSGDEDDDSIAATHAGAKRRIAHLEDQLSSLKEAVTKRKWYVIHYIVSISFC